MDPEAGPAIATGMFVPPMVLNPFSPDTVTFIPTACTNGTFVATVIVIVFEAHGYAVDWPILANLLCRLPSPSACLRSLSGPRGLVRPGGLAVIVSPYTWMDEHTPREVWLGGYAKADGTEVRARETLITMLDNDFELMGEEDMPMLIREHERKYQYVVSHAMVFRRREQ